MSRGRSWAAVLAGKCRSGPMKQWIHCHRVPPRSGFCRARRGPRAVWRCASRGEVSPQKVDGGLGHRAVGAATTGRKTRPRRDPAWPGRDPGDPDERCASVRQTPGRAPGRVSRETTVGALIEAGRDARPSVRTGGCRRGLNRAPEAGSSPPARRGHPTDGRRRWPRRRQGAIRDRQPRRRNPPRPTAFVYLWGAGRAKRGEWGQLWQT